MKKALKTALIILIVLLIIGTAIGGYFIWRHHALYIGADAALGAALDDAGVLAAETFDVDVDFEHEYGRSCYEVQFETAEAEYDYAPPCRGSSGARRIYVWDAESYRIRHYTPLFLFLNTINEIPPGRASQRDYSWL